MLVEHKIPYRSIIVRILPTVVFFILYSLAIYILDKIYGYSFLVFSSEIIGFVGTGISIFLAFITNSAYDRWWEARKVWGGIVNDSRSLVRQTKAFVDFEDYNNNPEIYDEVRQIATRQIAWVYALKSALRRENVVPAVRPHLKDSEEEVLKSSNVPSAILTQHSDHISRLQRAGKINEYQAVQLERVVEKLCDHMGACERIKNTIFPTQYSFFIHTFILLFLMILPLGLVHEYGWMSLAISGAIGVLFLMIEGFEATMQDPFDGEYSDTPMTSLCRTIEINLLEDIGSNDIPEPHKPIDGILM